MVCELAQLLNQKEQKKTRISQMTRYDRVSGSQSRSHATSRQRHKEVQIQSSISRVHRIARLHFSICIISQVASFFDHESFSLRFSNRRTAHSNDTFVATNVRGAPARNFSEKSQFSHGTTQQPRRRVAMIQSLLSSLERHLRGIKCPRDTVRP